MFYAISHWMPIDCLYLSLQSGWSFLIRLTPLVPLLLVSAKDEQKAIVPKTINWTWWASYKFAYSSLCLFCIKGRLNSLRWYQTTMGNRIWKFYVKIFSKYISLIYMIEIESCYILVCSGNDTSRHDFRILPVPRETTFTRALELFFRLCLNSVISYS